MNRNHQSQNTLNHTATGRNSIARKQMGRSMHAPASYNPKEFQHITYNEDTSYRDSHKRHFSQPETSYQAWISHSDNDFNNYASDGPGPIEIEARDKYTHKHLYNPIPDFHGQTFSYRARVEMDRAQHREINPSYAGIGPKGYKRSDSAIEDEVCHLLTADKYIDASSISVDVENRIVTLSGFVHDRRDKFAIEDLVEKVSGVEDVQNNLRVEWM